jgi:hypothetical protein
MHLPCLHFWHKLYVVRSFSDRSRQVACAKCEKAWGMNDDVQAFIAWDQDLEGMHRSFSYVRGHSLKIYIHATSLKDAEKKLVKFTSYFPEEVELVDTAKTKTGSAYTFLRCKPEIRTHYTI